MVDKVLAVAEIRGAIIGPVRVRAVGRANQMFQNEPALAKPEKSFPPQVLFHLAPDFPWEGMRAMVKLNAVTASVVDSPRMAGWRLR